MANVSDKCQRWRKIAIDQLGYALNLILTFSIAGLGYCFVLLRDKEFILVSSAKCSMILALCMLGISPLFGIFCVLNRLIDFRGTARRACEHPDAPTQDELRSLGQVTWWSFYIHLVTFALGVLALGITLLLTFGSKLV
jgi:hypothetical protein